MSADIKLSPVISFLVNLSAKQNAPINPENKMSSVFVYKKQGGVAMRQMFSLNDNSIQASPPLRWTPSQTPLSSLFYRTGTPTDPGTYRYAARIPPFPRGSVGGKKGVVFIPAEPRSWSI